MLLPPPTIHQSSISIRNIGVLSRVWNQLNKNHGVVQIERKLNNWCYRQSQEPKLNPLIYLFGCSAIIYVGVIKIEFSQLSDDIGSGISKDFFGMHTVSNKRCQKVSHLLHSKRWTKTISATT